VTTNLFFTVNYMHDLFYDSGFDEVSGNPQWSNYGRGGIENDPIRAEAQDFSGTDNANASAFSDGTPPRIQMYLWDTTVDNRMVVNTPSGISTIRPVGVGASSGPKIFNVTNDVVLYNDTTPT